MAGLPGVLRDKRAAWESGVRELHEIVAEYAAASDGTDDRQLPDVAEPLHARYEMLVRVVRRAIPEVDASHVVRYRFHHHDMPADDLDAIRASVEKWKERMATLDRTELTGRPRSKTGSHSPPESRRGLRLTGEGYGRSTIFLVFVAVDVSSLAT